MNEETTALPLTCGSCKHWHKHPTTGSILLRDPNQPVVGECVQGPPPGFLIPPGRLVFKYPVLPDNWQNSRSGTQRPTWMFRLAWRFFQANGVARPT